MRDFAPGENHIGQVNSAAFTYQLKQMTGLPEHAVNNSLSQHAPKVIYIQEAF
jgi:hypothetical protein